MTVAHQPSVLRFVKEKLGPIRDDHRILDVGAGPGDLWKKLRIHPKRLTLLDEERNYLQKKWGAVVASGEKLPVKTASMSHVVATGAVDFMDKVRALSEASRVLKPNGRLVMVLDHPQSPYVGNFELKRRFLTEMIPALEKIKAGRPADTELSNMDRMLEEITGHDFKIRHADERQIAAVRDYFQERNFSDFPDQVTELLHMAYTVRMGQHVAAQTRDEHFESALTQHLRRARNALQSIEKVGLGNKSRIYRNPREIRRALEAQGFDPETIEIEVLSGADARKPEIVGWGVAATKKYSVDWTKGKIRS